MCARTTVMFVGHQKPGSIPKEGEPGSLTGRPLRLYADGYVHSLVLQIDSLKSGLRASELTPAVRCGFDPAAFLT